MASWGEMKEEWWNTLEEEHLTCGTITDGNSKTHRYVRNTCKSMIYKHHRTKWRLSPALTIDYLFNIDSEALPLSGAFIVGSNVLLPSYFSWMFISVEKSRVFACNYTVWQDCKIQHFASSIMENLSESLNCVCACIFLPMLSPELFLLFLLGEKQNGIQKGKCNLRFLLLPISLSIGLTLPQWKFLKEDIFVHIAFFFLWKNKLN